MQAGDLLERIRQYAMPNGPVGAAALGCDNLGNCGSLPTAHGCRLGQNSGSRATESNSVGKLGCA